MATNRESISRGRFAGVTFRLTLLFLVFVLLPTALLSGLTYHFGSVALKQAAMDKLESAIALKERTIDAWFEEEKSFLRVVAHDLVVRDYGIRLIRMQESDPAYNESYAVLLAHLQTILSTTPNLLRLSVLSDIGGREILSTDPAHVGRYHLTDSFFTLGREGTYVQKVYFSKRQNAAVMIVATPLKSQDGDTVGVLYAALDPNFLSDIMLDRTGMGATGETYVVDTRHMLVTDVNGALPDNNREIGSEGIDAALNRQNGHGIYNDYNDIPVIGFYRWLEEPRLALLAEIELDEALAPIAHFKNVIVYAVFFIVGVALVVSWLVARGISQPVLAVVAAAKGVAQGDLDQIAPVQTRDEIGELSESFNAMTRALRQTAIEKDRVLDDLHQSNHKLQAATDAKNIFLANMSHELRTPLNAIIGYSEILEEQATEDGRTNELADFKRIQAAGRHLLALIDDILDLTRIEAGKIELSTEVLSLPTFVADLVDIAKPLMQRQSNLLQVSCPEDIGELVTDSTRMRQILLNLLGNAAKFTNQGSITLAVEKTIRGETCWVRFCVRDTGIGIAPDLLSRIFQPFVQGDASATKRFGGAGLGLAITKRLCELIGGHIQVTSVLGKGTAFVVEVPERRATTATGSTRLHTPRSQIIR